MEAKKMSIYEYDAEKHLRMEREAAREEGRIDLLTDLVKKNFQKACLSMKLRTC